jgi:ATP-binding cassette subfamily B protein
VVVVTRIADEEPSRAGFGQLPRLCRQAVAITWNASRGDLVIALTLQAISALSLVLLLLVGQAALAALLRAITDGAALGTMVPWVLAVAGVAAFQSLLAAVQREREHVLGEEVNRYVEGRLLDVTTAVDLALFDSPDFHNRVRRSQLGAKLSYTMVRGLFGIAAALFGVAAGLVVVASAAPQLLALLVLAALPAWIASSKRGKEFHTFMRNWTERDRLRAYLAALLQARQPAKEVRAFGLAPHLRRRYERLYADRMGDLRRLARRQIWINIAANAAIGVVLGATLLAVAWLTLHGGVPLASAGIAVAGTAVVGQRLASLGWSVGALSESGRHLDDYLAFDAMLPRIRADRPTGAAPPGFTALSAVGVGFRYPAATEPVLHDVSLDLRAGEVVALVGENGSGKTTLAKLLAGLYRPDAGTIAWDGVDMAGVEPDAWRDRVAVIFQDFERYHLSAGENIGLGRIERADDADAVRAAARQAGADTFIEAFPAGYATLLGPEFAGGTDLSVGQWQRVALARAFFRGAPVVILDEPTAALDPRAERELFDRIRTLLAGRTVLLISHRFSSVRSADRIYVLEAGRVVESGAHDTLMALNGLYAELFTLQAAAYAD